VLVTSWGRGPICVVYASFAFIFISWPYTVAALVVIACLHGGTTLAAAYDHVLPSRRPERWHLPALAVVALACGAVAAVSSLLLLLVALQANTPGSLLWGAAAGPLTYGQVLTARVLHSSTFQLNLSAFCGIGGALRVC